MNVTWLTSFLCIPVNYFSVYSTTAANLFVPDVRMNTTLPTTSYYNIYYTSPPKFLWKYSISCGEKKPHRLAMLTYMTQINRQYKRVE